MNRQEISQKVIAIVSQIFGHAVSEGDRLIPDSDDPFAYVPETLDLVSNLHDEFGVRFHRGFYRVVTVGDLVSFVEGLLNQS